MWEYNVDIQGMVIIGLAAALNIVLLKKLAEIFSTGKFWLWVTLGSVEAACYLIPYFALGEIFYVQEIAGGSLLFLLCFFLIRKTGRAEGERRKPEGKRLFLLLVTPVTGLAALFSLLLGEVKPRGLAALCSACILAADLSVFYLYDVLMQNDTHVRQRDVFRQQTDHYRNQLEVIEESGNRLRALRHDMKNHMLHLQAELQKGHVEDALHYLEEMGAELQNPVEYVKTGNREVDSLLNYKLRRAEQVLSEVEQDIRVPMEWLPKSFDINVILGNLLDNAIEAAGESERKWLKFVLRADKGVLLIQIANSCDLAPRKTGRRFLSTKAEAGEHGVGLQSVKRMVEKRKGNIEFTYEEGVFLAEVLLYRNEL